MALISGAIFVLAHFQALTNPFVINDDVRQQIFWMQQWQDPAFSGATCSPTTPGPTSPGGLKGSTGWPPGGCPHWPFSKLLPGFLFVLLALCLFQIGSRLADRRLGWFMVACFWLMPFFLDNLSGGLSRAFAAPLLALFWLGWLAASPGPWARPYCSRPSSSPTFSWWRPRPRCWPGPGAAGPGPAAAVPGSGRPLPAPGPGRGSWSW